MIRSGRREGSGARTIGGENERDAGALIFAARFRLRYSRIHGALCAGSRYAKRQAFITLCGPIGEAASFEAPEWYTECSLLYPCEGVRDEGP